MAKAVFHRRFNATDTKKGVSIRIEMMGKPQSFPEWVIAKAETAGAATRYVRTQPESTGLQSKDE